MWRWSYEIAMRSRLKDIFSTYVEVILVTVLERLRALNFLHVCGGDPGRIRGMTDELEFSPRMWRWSLHYHHHNFQNQIFSTYVEVILPCAGLSAEKYYFLHVCGGDPNHCCVAILTIAFSPRMWRWSYTIHAINVTDKIFSTYVEVILM